MTTPTPSFYTTHFAPPETTQPKRAFIIVIDALGVGAMPDAPGYGDALTANTLGNIDANVDALNLPTLGKLGLGNILPLQHVSADAKAIGSWGKLAEQSIGKDTTTGHWEMMGITLETPFPTYPNGFPDELVQAFIAQTGCKGILGNKPASGTKILDELGEEHLKTGFPIVYTSADSVWQLACHVDVTPLETLYRWCEIARELLVGEHEVSRVIARPFQGSVAEGFRRLGSARHDYAVPPPSQTILDEAKRQGVQTIGVGKIHDIFCGVGITHTIHTDDNPHGLSVIEALVKNELNLADFACDKSTITDATANQLVFINLVETDMNYGHRRDVAGYAGALEAIDARLAGIVADLHPTDLLIITGDHGCDPTAPGSDHTREYVPFLAFTPNNPTGEAVGTLQGFAHVGRLALQWVQI
jgi:phosphopentomutase